MTPADKECARYMARNGHGIAYIAETLGIHPDDNDLAIAFSEGCGDRSRKFVPNPKSRIKYPGV
jgi:hypothetical protein